MGATLLQWTFQPYLEGSSFMLPLCGVVLVALYAGLWPALFAVILTAFGVSYFSLPPTGTLRIEAAHWAVLGVYGALGFLVAWVASGFSRWRRSWQEGEARLRAAEQARDQAIRDSEARLRAFFDQAAVGIAYARPGGRMVEFNERFRAIYGYEEDELRELTFREITHPDDLAEGVALYQRLLAGDIPHYTREKRCLRKGGEIVWVTLTVCAVRDADGTVQYTMVILQDITDRKRAEEALRESQARLRLITDSVPVLIAHVDADRRYRFVNRQYEAWFGISREEIEGMPVEEFLGKEVYAKVRPRIDAALRGEPVQYEDYLPYATGGRHTRGSYVPHRDERGQVLGFFAMILDVTEPTLVREALRAREEEFRTMFELAGSGKVQADPVTGRLTRVNRKFCSITGYATEELLEMTLERLVHPEDRARYLAAAETVLEGGAEEWHSETRFVRRGGEIIWVSIAGSVLRDITGRPVRVFAVAQDITGRKAAEQALRESEERFRELTENLREAFWMKDARTGQIIYMSPAYETIWGRPREPLYGDFQSFLATIHPDDVARVRAALPGQLDDGYSEEYRIVRPDGAIRWVWARAFPVRNDRSEVYRIAGFSQDITERRSMEERLRRNEERLRVAIRSSGIVVMNQDLDLRYTWIHNSLGIPPEAILGRRDDELVPPAQARPLMALKQRVIDTRQGARETVELTVGDSSRIYDLTVEPLWNGDREVVGITGAAYDITRQVRIEQELRALTHTLEERVAERTEALERTYEALRQSERLAAIGQMVTGLSHESRNALQRSYACLQMLERRFRENAAILHLVREGLAAHEDLRRVFEEVQGYAAPLVLERKPVDLSAVWRTAWGSLENLRRDRDVAFTETFETAEIRLEADGFRMQQVFRNLFENALAACLDPARIAVICTNATFAGNPALRIVVRDNGPGLDEEQAQRIFEPFYTTKTKGTGLGMSIVRRIVEAHDGRIHVAAAPGRGLDAIIDLPRAAERPGPIEPQAAVSAPAIDSVPLPH